MFSGEKGKRHCLPHASIMIHRTWSVCPDPRCDFEQFVQSHREGPQAKHLISLSTPRRFFASVAFSRTSIKTIAVNPGSPGKLVYYALVCYHQLFATKRLPRKSQIRDGARTRLLHDRHVQPSVSLYLIRFSLPRQPTKLCLLAS